MIGFWNNGLEIITDPYTLAPTAQIRLVTSVFTRFGPALQTLIRRFQ